MVCGLHSKYSPKNKPPCQPPARHRIVDRTIASGLFRPELKKNNEEDDDDDDDEQLPNYLDQQ